MISKKESNAISIVRIFAMILILMCHFLQAYSNRWAWVLNVGVQIFLVLSGYLYGSKHVRHWGIWFLRRFIKLYVPLFIYTTVALTAIKYLTDTPVSWLNYVRMGGVAGLDHLWFMKAIGICYLTTPVLQLLRKYNVLLFFVLIVVAVLEYGAIRYRIFTFSYLWLYAFGYSYSGLAGNNKNRALFVLSLVTIVLTCFSKWNLILDYDSGFNRSFHSLWGCLICLGGIFGISKLNIRKLPNIVNICDKNAFYVYITHHIYLLGPLTLIPLFDNKSVCTIAVLMIIGLSTAVLSIIANYIVNKLMLLIS